MKLSLLTEIAEENKLVNRLEKAVTHAKSAFIAISFCNDAGLKYLFQKTKLLLEEDRDLTIFISGYLGITEPKALETLLRLSRNYSTLKAYFKPHGRFHSKFLFFPQIDSTYFLFLGSSNISLGGLTAIGELNVQIQGKSSDPVNRDIQIVMRNLKKDRSFRKIDKNLIDEYKKRRRPRNNGEWDEKNGERGTGMPFLETMLIYRADRDYSPRDKEAIKAVHPEWKDYVDYIKPLPSLDRGDYFLNIWDSRQRKTFTVSTFIEFDNINDVGKVAHIMSGKDVSTKILEKELKMKLKEIHKKKKLDIVEIALLRKKIKKAFPQA